MYIWLSDSSVPGKPDVLLHNWVNKQLYNELLDKRVSGTFTHK